MGRGEEASGHDREGVVVSDEPTQVGGVALDMGLCQGRGRGSTVPMRPRVEELGINQQPPSKHNDTPSHMPHELVTESCDRVWDSGKTKRCAEWE